MTWIYLLLFLLPCSLFAEVKKTQPTEQAQVPVVVTKTVQLQSWGETEIRQSHTTYTRKLTAGTAPLYKADPLNLFLVIESGDRHVTLLDGITFEPMHRLANRSELPGEPVFSADGRYVYFVFRDGWISKFDLHTQETISEIRVGTNTRNAALSSDDKHLIVANVFPHTLVILKTDDMSLIKVIPVATGKDTSSRVSAVYNAAPRNSFVATLQDSAEVWEINYENPAPAGFGQPWSHDYREDSGDAIREMFPIRRLSLDFILDDYFFDQKYIHLLGTSSSGDAQVLDLDLGRTVATLKLPEMPRLSSGVSWNYQGSAALAAANGMENSISLIDLTSWKLIKKIVIAGSGFYLDSHENTPYIWANVPIGDDQNLMYIIDKQKFGIFKALQAEPGGTSTQVEFTRDGGHALVSIREVEGSVVVYDAKSLKIVKRIAMSKPAGKYNVFNRITRSSTANQ